METPKKLYKSTKNKILGGVCAGIADYLNMDPTIIRILWVVLGFVYGFGVLAYIVAWLIMPDNPN